MPKKIMTVQVDDESEVSETPKMIEASETSKRNEKSKISEITPAKPPILEKKTEALDPGEETGPLMSAEEVTKMAMNFLKGLGNKYVMPKRVSKESDQSYGVEVDMKGRVASILIDRSTKEIMEYEITETKKEREISSGGGHSSFSPKIIVIVCVIQIILMVVFNFLKLYNINIPFLTGLPVQ